jgi:hypothetical protein
MGVPLAKGDPASRIEDVRAVIHARDPAVPIVYAQPMTALYAAPFANSECFCCCWAR